MSKTLNLMLHTGGKTAGREQILATPTPDRTETWYPIPHGRILEGVQQTLERAGLRVVSEAHGLSHEGNRYFGLLQLENGIAHEDYSLTVGIRNSHDKTFPAGLVVGSGVFVCDNLAFSGEIKIARKHTRYIERDLPNLIDRAVGRLGDLRRGQDERISAYKLRELSDAQVHDLLIRSLDAGVVAASRIPKVLGEYRQPRHPEFRPRTAWSLFNAYTEIMKETNLFRRPRTTQALHGILDAACSLN